MENSESGLHSNLKGCLVAIRQLRLSSPGAHPIIKILTKSLDDHLTMCLSVCSGDAKKLYPYIADILNNVQASYHSRLTLYYSRSPYWQHYMANMNDIIRILNTCLHHRTTHAHASLPFQRKFQPLTNVNVRKPPESCGFDYAKRASMPLDIKSAMEEERYAQSG